MTVPMSRNGREEAENNGRQNEKTPLIPSIKESDESNVSSRSVQFDKQSSRKIESLSSRSQHYIHKASSYLEHFTKSERDHAIELHPGIGDAAFLIRDAVVGETENPSEGAYNPYSNPDLRMRNTISIVCSRICSRRSVRKFIILVVWAGVLLSFVEPPAWCFDIPGLEITEEDTKKVGHCWDVMSLTGPPADDPHSDESVQYYPNSIFFLLTRPQTAAIESVCLVIMIVYFLLLICRDGCYPTVFLRPGRARLPRIFGTGSVAALCIGLAISVVRDGYYSRVLAPLFRIFLLVSLSVDSRRELRTIITLMPEVMTIVFLLFIFIAFYAWMGVVGFYGTPEAKQHFPNLIDGMWTLWIAVTTANYPDVMMPAYNRNRLAALYFVVFMAITFFFLMNVILASVVNAYDNELDRRRIASKQTSQRELHEAFALLQKNGVIDRDTVMALFLILNDDFPEFRTIPDDEAKLLFALLDKDGSNQISEDEFMNFGKVMMVEFERSDVYTTLVEKYLPALYGSTRYQKFSSFVKSDWFEGMIDVLLVLNAVVIAIQSFPELSGEYVELDPKIYNGKIDSAWEYVETAFTVIYVLEAWSKIMVLSWRRYTASPRNVFDFVVTFSAVLATCYVYYPNAYSNSRLIRYIIMARVLRLARLLFMLKPFQLIAKISLEIIPMASHVIMLLFCILYLFASLGVYLYGGMITRDPNNALSYMVLGTDFSENDYWANNFNDMISGLNVLFNLLVVNNWTTEWIGYEAVTESKLCRLYFLGFYVFGVILVNNVVIAFIVNAFIDGWDNQQELNAQHQVSDALIEGREAVFNASKITGTATFVSGTYIAKLKRRTAAHHSVRGVDVLKGLFTKTDSQSDDEEIHE